MIAKADASTQVQLKQSEDVIASMNHLVAKLKKRMKELRDKNLAAEYDFFTQEVEDVGYFFFVKHPRGEFTEMLFGLLEAARRGFIRRHKILHYLVTYPYTQQGGIAGVPFIQGWLTNG